MKFFDAVELMKQGVICKCGDDLFKMTKITEEFGHSVVNCYWRIERKCCGIMQSNRWERCSQIYPHEIFNDEWKEFDE